MKDILNFIDLHPFLACAVAFFVLFYCLFFFCTYNNVSEIVQNWQDGKEDNINEIE
jgi:hypothetical protein